MEIETKVTTLAFDIYFNSLEPVGMYKDRLILLAETKSIKNIVTEKYRDLLLSEAARVLPAIAAVDIITEDDVENLGSVSTELDIEAPPNFVQEKDEGAKFRENYTFDSFVVGKSNEFATAVCKAVAEKPGEKYNPLFIWGGVGLGKTHLLHAIGNYIRRNNPDKKTAYVSSEKFTNELIEALRDSKSVDSLKSFRNKYRSLDILMIDDIQFFVGKESTKEEFFHTFNELYLFNKQIIICSDRPPKEIDIEERLKTRFALGVIADIAPPDLETRIAILQKKCYEKRQNVNRAVIELIATRITNNIREMEGVLDRIISYASLVRGDCNDMDIVNNALKDYSESRSEIITMDNITDATCEYFHIKREEIVGKKRTKEIVVPRQICIYLITELLPAPLISIDEYFGGKDHTTIMHARDKIAEDIKTNGTLAGQVKDIRDRLCNR
jgi:chromosomal replication initiator protein